VLSSRDYILGSAVEAFEQAFATHEGARHAVGVASGTDALALSLRALRIGPGDEVIVPALTFAGTAQAVLQCGASPRFVDVDPTTRCIDVSAASAAITPRTAAILPVHLFGHPADMTPLLRLAQQNGLAIVQDAAQSHGATIDGSGLGGLGQAAAYSFYPTKNLGCAGDGGMVLTNDAALAGQIRSLRHYGFEGGSRVSQSIGFNSRLDELQAAILLVLLPQLNASNAERRHIAARYRDLLTSSQIGLPPDAAGCVYHQFAITYADRDGLMRHLAERGIGSALHYTPGLHRHPAFSGGATEPLPVTDALAQRLLSLPIQPEVALSEVEHIASVILEYTGP
jgi:dTDP-3-amino-3,4,6-trideoxy-alpha-D-glucose transaminase